MKINIQEKYNLTPKTSPVDYADMLLSITKILSEIFTVKIMKESLLQEVPDGVRYQNLKTFNPQDIQNNVSLYISHEISPSPEL